MFKLVKNDTHWLAFGVAETVIVARAADVKNLAGLRASLSYPCAVIEVLHYSYSTDIFGLKFQKH